MLMRLQVSQLGNAHSALLTGFVSDSINPGQGAGQVQVMSVGSAGGAAGSTTGHFHVTADNGFEAYVNGEEVGTGDDWTVTYDLPFDAPCGSGNAVYAVHANDAGGPAALIGSITHCGGTSPPLIPPCTVLSLLPYPPALLSPAARR